MFRLLLPEPLLPALALLPAAFFWDASILGVGGVEDVDAVEAGLAGGMLMLRTLSRMICRIVFRNAFRNSAVLQ